MSVDVPFIHSEINKKMVKKIILVDEVLMFTNEDTCNECMGLENLQMEA